MGTRRRFAPKRPATVDKQPLRRSAMPTAAALFRLWWLLPIYSAQASPTSAVTAYQHGDLVAVARDYSAAGQHHPIQPILQFNAGAAAYRAGEWSASSTNAGDGLRADHVIGGGGTPSLTPYYYQPVYLSIPFALILAFSGAGFWARRRERSVVHSIADKDNPYLDPEPMLRLMDDAMIAGDPELFFKSARAALQRNLASNWQLPPDAITLEEVAARLGAKSDVARVFTLAVESACAAVKLTAPEFQRWKRLVLGHINRKAMS